MDIATPRNVKLSAFFQRSNAAINAKERIPCCLKAIIYELKNKLPDILSHYGEEAHLEMLSIITQIENLKTEVDEDTPFRKLYSKAPDVQFYNDYLDKMTVEDCRPTMLQTVRMYAECYVYRRVWECFELAKLLPLIDPYESMKQEIYRVALPVMIKVGQYLQNIYKHPSENDKDDFEKLIKLNLWATMNDCTMSKVYITYTSSQLLNTKRKEAYIVCNQLEKAWNVISNRTHKSNVIAFMCNKTGLELFLDLCVADYLFTNYYARSIHFHVKHIPWFISDVTENDVHWTLQELSKCQEKNIKLLASNWREHFRTGRWKIIVRKYWVLPFGYSKMKIMDPQLYGLLEDTKIIIIKGDYHYRKLVEDLNLDPLTPLSRSCLGFHPSDFFLIRIISSSILCNMSKENIFKLENVDKDWMDSELYGLIQFSEKPAEICDCLGI